MSLPALRVLSPLRHRDFRRLVIGMLASLLGDGFFRVAIALQVYAISGDNPTALSAVAATWAISQVITLPIGGAAVDRFERRKVMIVADLWRGALMGALGLLSLSGQLELWHMLVIGAGFGAGNGFFNPAATAMVPDLLPDAELVRANAFLGIAKPGMVWLLGPLLGAAVISSAGTGAAFLCDGATFLFSAAMLVTIQARPALREGSYRLAETVRDAVDGLRFVKANRWAWIWLVAAGISTMLFAGPFDILVPNVLLFEFGMSQSEAARAMALIFVAGGSGSIVVSVVLGQRALPRRFMTVMFISEALGLSALIGFGLMTSLWQAVIAGLLAHTTFALTEIIWTTTMQLHVPRNMLGRVSSLDWMTAIGVAPIGLAMAGPLGQALGARTVLVGAGLFGCAAILALLMLPGSRDLERRLAAEAAAASPRALTRPSVGA
ncbi:MAG TPA: MFS transporter [Egibacteraceae bacterium]|nr:MFS transporter [Egibacteraceae bacterium]